MTSTEAELENFRQQWREEVSAKTRGKSQQSTVAATKAPQAASSSSLSGKPHVTKSSVTEASQHARHRSVEEIDEYEPHLYPDLGEAQHGRRLDETNIPPAASGSKEPQSALEHYEKAVEKESQGSLGDSVNLYRKAFRVSYILLLIKIFVFYSSRRANNT
jgi:F-box protein 9